MIQEIITYLVIASAFSIAIWKMVKKFRKKKRKKETDYKNGQISFQHNCSDCAAECALRDASSSVIKSNPGLCEKISEQD